MRVPAMVFVLLAALATLAWGDLPADVKTAVGGFAVALIAALWPPAPPDAERACVRARRRPAPERTFPIPHH